MGLFDRPDIRTKRTADTDWQTEMADAESALDAAGKAKREGRWADAADLENAARARLDSAASARQGN